MIEVSRLSGTRPGHTPVENVSFVARPGAVTAILDVTGTVSTDVARLILGRDRPSAGSALIDGQVGSSIDHAAAVVGAVLRPMGARLWHSPREHLRRVAAAAGAPVQSSEEILELVGLTQVAGDRIWGLPAGARLRLAVGAAMMGMPDNYVLDDPFRGLTEEDSTWLRQVLRRLAAQNRTVLLAGGTPMQWGRVVDRVVTIGAEGVTADIDAEEFLARLGTRRVVVRADRQAELSQLLAGMGAGVTKVYTDSGESIAVTGLDFEDVCRASVGYGVLELREADRSLDRVLAELAGRAVPRVGVLADRGIA